ncbi:molybdopterin synthase sulfur carrier subunit [Roseivirga seohaensis]|uniref:Molybdopterin synthase sulfur carrier subunit n=2 Tax=Roseivirga seohaensis TaxID=1914963 RepID=A0A0L8AIQ8_9BACT|nr:MoaD/ThiS family protein [Roseivirga seohaensis]KOF02323.1 molybdopterin converting factor [Roseivirga seohaensis subsp. aquiponti]KYG82987.1 molybdopterin synthase sulfur carrier subunit [Roseivirga seohaensis]|tara:strand:- start:2277 stop:2519 length:243 start_codon:yes stop_codon:yes gene_type:complete
MKIEVIAFGIAKDILNSNQVTLEMEEQSSVADVRQALVDLYPAFQGLASLQLAVNADYVSDDYLIKENDEVVLIPPVSGG